MRFHSNKKLFKNESSLKFEIALTLLFLVSCLPAAPANRKLVDSRTMAGGVPLWQ